MNNICTSIDQSRKLVELGLNPETSDMVYPAWTLSDTPTDDICKIRTHDFESENDVPTWSLSALLELMPQRIYMHGAAHQFRLDRNWDKVTWQCAYDAMNSFIEKKSNSPINAVFEMMCWLLENDYIKKGGKE